MVQDVITSFDFPLVETLFVAVNNSTSFSAELEKVHQEAENRKGHVLIVPADKSMDIIQDKQRIYLLDIHNHNHKGKD